MSGLVCWDAPTIRARVGSLLDVYCRLYRMPSLACAAASAQRTADTTNRCGLSAPARPSIASPSRCRSSPLPRACIPPFLPSCILPPPPPTPSRPVPCCCCSGAGGGVDLSSTYYALNPSGDLAATQAAFQDWFRGMRGWEVRRRRGGGHAGWLAATLAESAPAVRACGAGRGRKRQLTLTLAALALLVRGVCRARRDAPPRPRSSRRRCRATLSSCTADTAVASSTSQVGASEREGRAPLPPHPFHVAPPATLYFPKCPSTLCASLPLTCTSPCLRVLFSSLPPPSLQPPGCAAWSAAPRRC